MATATLPLVLASGARLELGERLGSGGEGTVFAVQGAPTLVAKIYSGTVEPDRERKLRAMVGMGSPALDAVTAWPVDLVLSSGRLVGFMMPKAQAAKEAHILYGPKSRRREFPNAGFRFLVHAAMNVARAFAVIHERGIVIGDVNERLAMIDQDAVVRIIDCDSFQITAGGSHFMCDVGVPTFTPPELQGIPTFRGVTRTEQHDLFGLAVLIFHLLFIGRHPFAGRRHDSTADATIETAIKESRFAYSAHRERTRMEPPPHMPCLETSGALAQLFEASFAPSAASGRS